ncbi:hypothetical protein AB6A40_006144 [Gnathostoma spinigerum]|uniref:SXP/RAL-2 family protein Ani s 5-like cation-binding domain-containing protein n=1 Tax=Gnathostoma spinigerum TaxID=75299 RepID=A0ABD6EIN7_9BILA
MIMKWTLTSILLVGYTLPFVECTVPPFLHGARASTIDDFNRLLAAADKLTDKQLQAEVDTWIALQDTHVKDAYKDFAEQQKEAKELVESAHQAAVANMSPSAQDADERMASIANDPTLTGEQKRSRIQSIFDELEPTVKHQLANAALAGRWMVAKWK